MTRKKRPLTPFGREVTIYCVKRGVTCAELAAQAGVSKYALSQVMHGDRSGTGKVIAAVRKAMIAMRQAPDSMAK